jgi:predicted nuclease of predicted toxin-antitoxin system
VPARTANQADNVQEQSARLNLLLDENLSPQLIPRLTTLGIFAQHAAHVGLSGKSDFDIWLYAFEHDQIVVTINAKDFLSLATGSEVHPALVILRESGLTPDEQWTRLEPAFTIIREEENQGRELINRVIEVFAADHRVIRDLPP